MHPHGDHPLAGRFNALEPDLVLDAVQVEGWRPTGRFMVLNSFENRVYRLDLEDAQGTLRRVVGKFYRPGRWSLAAIEDEHDFLFELDDAGVPVVLPLALDGEEQTIGALSGAAEGIRYSLYDHVPGRSPDEFTDPELRTLGQQLAELHDVGSEEDAPDRPELTPETYGRANLDFLLEHERIPPAAEANYEATVEALIDRIAPRFVGVPTHRIHGDCHRGNLLRRDGGFAFLDFDDMVIGPAAQDVWMLTPSYDAEGQRRRAILLEGYRDVRDFDPAWLGLVEPLRALRMIHYATWIARRWDDPIFRRTFGHFGTLRYWQQETDDLREQIARIDLDVHGLHAG